MKSRKSADRGIFSYVGLRAGAVGIFIGVMYVALSLILILGLDVPAIPTIVVLGAITVVAAMSSAVIMGRRARTRNLNADYKGAGSASDGDRGGRSAMEDDQGNP